MVVLLEVILERREEGLESRLKIPWLLNSSSHPISMVFNKVCEAFKG